MYHIYTHVYLYTRHGHNLMSLLEQLDATLIIPPYYNAHVQAPAPYGIRALQNRDWDPELTGPRPSGTMALQAWPRDPGPTVAKL